jgi:hypothetical protein
MKQSAKLSVAPILFSGWLLKECSVKRLTELHQLLGTEKNYITFLNLSFLTYKTWVKMVPI